MKRIDVLVLLLLAACRERQPPQLAAHRIRVGLPTPASVNDNGWNAVDQCRLRFHLSPGERGGARRVSSLQRTEDLSLGSNNLSPDVIVASVVLDMPSAFVHMAKTVRDRRFQPKIYWLGMKEGIVSLVWNDRLKSTG